MSERSKSDHRGRGLVAGGALLATLALAACGGGSGDAAASKSDKPGTSPESRASKYCTDDPADRAQPIRVENGRLIVRVHGECTGDPKAPVGAYREPTQLHGPAVVALPNGTEFAVRCLENGEYVRTDAVAWYKGPAHTGSTEWLVGTVPLHPDAGEVAIPDSNLGFPPTSMGSLVLGNC